MKTLAEMTTLRIGGAPQRVVDVVGPEELAEAVKTADRAGEEILVVGGGSNLLVGDQDFPGVVIRDRSDAVSLEDFSGCGGNSVRVAAGVTWDDFVSFCIDEEWMGVEALSGIPGTVGAAPIQNIGAYGQEVAETLASVSALDRLTGRIEHLPLFDLHMGYRNSMLKRSLLDEKVGGGKKWGPTGRWVVLEVEFQFRNASLSSPIRYAELAKKLDVNLGDRVPSKELRQAVLELRRSKGMLLDSSDHDTWSAGSFFTNPIMKEDGDAAKKLPSDAPRFPVEKRSLVSSIAGKAPTAPGIFKTSAAWLISKAGFEKGYRVRPDSEAALSTKHVLALTNRGGATSAEMTELARTVRDGVEEMFGIQLVPEPVLVGCEL